MKDCNEEIKFRALEWDNVDGCDSKTWSSEPMGLYYLVFESHGIFRAACLINGEFTGKQICDTKELAQEWCYKHYNAAMNAMIDRSN